MSGESYLEELLDSMATGNMVLVRHYANVKQFSAVGLAVSEYPLRPFKVTKREVHLLAGLFATPGGIMGVLVMNMNGELYETWLNLGNRDIQSFIHSLAYQNSLEIFIQSPEYGKRHMKIDNLLRHYFQTVDEDLPTYPPTSDADFEQGRAWVTSQYPTIHRLYTALNSNSRFRAFDKLDADAPVFMDTLCPN